VRLEGLGKLEKFNNHKNKKERKKEIHKSTELKVPVVILYRLWG
jgi:hypothetical protein